jgi:hypothetical protein
MFCLERRRMYAIYHAKVNKICENSQIGADNYATLGEIDKNIYF